jgi:hypothetical protein
MGHVVLLGDSIFDNALYVHGRPPVIAQVQKSLPPGWTATLLAVDGHTTEGVSYQLKRLPPDATHLIVSAGGNDALQESGILRESVANVAQALTIVFEARERFRGLYRQMLKELLAIEKPVAVCTVYDQIPGLGEAECSALACFNEIILREAFAARLPVIDLRLVCQDVGDYASVSPIEPSSVGGSKIARVIGDLLEKHEFERGRSVIYT